MIRRSLAELPADFGPCALTVGNFDGVHVGHQYILRRVREIAAEQGWQPAVLTFEPHPAKVVAPARAPKLLTTLDERCDLMHRQKIEQILVLPFNHALARLTPEEFVKQILVEKLRTRAVLVGDNFRFGNRAAGDTNTLRKLGDKYGFVNETVGAVSIRKQIVSSTEIRRRIEAGDVSVSGRMLGRPYALSGRVVHGHGIGAKRTVPTLNLETAAEVLPGRGVYITRTHDWNAARQWQSITNIGYRPTFGGETLSIETFLLTPLEGETPDEIRVEFLRRVRDERKFQDADALKAQILRDVSRAQTYFRRLGGLPK